jgi:ribosomal protein L34E
MQGNSTSARLQIVKNCQHDSTCKQQNIALHAIARMRPLHVNPSAACHGVKVVPMKSCLCNSCFPYLTGDLHTISKRFVRLWSLEPFTYIETVGAASPYMHAIKGRHALYMTCWVREYCRNRPFASVPRNIKVRNVSVNDMPQIKIRNHQQSALWCPRRHRMQPSKH